MINLQVVCKNVTLDELSEVLSRFGTLAIEERKGHLRVSLDPSDPVDEILEECRKHAYAYVRITAWEQGGGFERTGEARCVAGLEGEPMLPISVRTRGERANSKHGLFSSRRGLVLCRTAREDEQFKVRVIEYQLQAFHLEGPREIASFEFKGSPEEFVDGLDIEYDRYIPLIRAALRKVGCRYCSHVHYCEVKEEDRGGS